MSEEFLNYIKEYKNKERRNFKYCDCTGILLFDNIKLKIEGVIEPNYGRMRLGYELYFKNKKINHLNGYGMALDFELNHYLENKFLFFPVESGLIIIDTFNQEIKIFHHEYILIGIGKIKILGRELLLVNKTKYLILNFDSGLIKLYDKESFNLKKTLDFEIIDDIKIKKYSLSSIEKITHKIKTFANNI